MASRKETVWTKFSKAGCWFESLQAPADARESCCQAEQRWRSLPWSRRGREVEFQAASAASAVLEKLVPGCPVDMRACFWGDPEHNEAVASFEQLADVKI